MCLQGLMKFDHCLLKILRKNQNVADGRMERLKDNVKTVYPPTNTVCGGYKKIHIPTVTLVSAYYRPPLLMSAVCHKHCMTVIPRLHRSAVGTGQQFLIATATSLLRSAVDSSPVLTSYTSRHVTNLRGLSITLYLPTAYPSTVDLSTNVQ